MEEHRPFVSIALIQATAFLVLLVVAALLCIFWPTSLQSASAALSQETSPAIRFFNVSNVLLPETEDIDTIIVGSLSEEISPETNVLYLPASAISEGACTLRYALNAELSSLQSIETRSAAPAPEAAPNDPSDPGDPSPVVRVRIAPENPTAEATVTLEPSQQIELENGILCWHIVFSVDVQDIHVYAVACQDKGSMFFSTSKGLDYIHANKENRDKETSLAYVLPTGSVVYNTHGNNELKGRGNSTWGFEKRPYQIKLDKKTELVKGAGKAKTWILLANVLDESMIRNEIAFNLAESVGLDATLKGDYVNLYIDGAYKGLYFLCEKVQINENRIDIADLEDANAEANPDTDIDAIAPTVITNTEGTDFSHVSEVSFVDIPNEPEDVTGGYLIELDFHSRAIEELSYVTTKHGASFVIKSPEACSRAEMLYISHFLQEAEDAIFSESGENAAGRHFDEYLNIDSIAPYYALLEVLSSCDAFKSSTFFWKESDVKGSGQDSQKLQAGPIWDCDTTLDSTVSWPYWENVGSIFAGRSTGSGRFWIMQLRSHSDFQNAVRDRYRGTIAPLAQQLVESGIDKMAARISNDVRIDNLRWSVQKSGDYPYYSSGEPFVNFLGDFDGSVEDIKAFLGARTEALLEHKGFGSYEEGEVAAARVAGDTAMQTAAEISRQTFESNENAIVARADGYIDALAAAGFAGCLRCPILLMYRDQSYNDCVLEELVRLGVKHVYLAGGPAAVSEACEQAIQELGIETERIDGSRLEADFGVGGYEGYAIDTALEFAYRTAALSPTQDTILTTQMSFMDALSVSPVSYAQSLPLVPLAYETLELDARVQTFLEGRSGKVIVPGGPAAVPVSSAEDVFGLHYSEYMAEQNGKLSVETQQGDAAARIVRIAGDNGYLTSLAIAQHFVESEDVSPSTVCIANGAAESNGVDALAGAVLAGERGGTIVLACTEKELFGYANTVTLDHFVRDHAGSITRLYVLGGPSALNERLMQEAKAYLGVSCL